jgi:hypothetical protein
MSSRRNGAGNALDRAKVVLAETRVKLGELAVQRNAALLRGTDADVAKVDAAVEATEKLLRTHTDRVRLLEGEAEKEAAERRAKEHAALIGRVEAKLAERNRAVAKLADCVAAADAALVEVFALNRAILAAWPWGNNLGAVLLGDGMAVNALRHEIYRVSGRPPATGGMPGDPRGPSYPGGVAEDIMWAMMPERIKPIVEKFAAASAAASVIMKTGRNGPAPVTNGAAAHPSVTASPGDTGQSSIVPTPQVAPQKGSPEMIRLLSRQNELVSGPMDDAADREYELISARLRELGELGEGASQ